MAAYNKVMLLGNLTRDPELSFMPSQTAVCDFGVAVNRTWTGSDGVKKEEVTFVDVTAFGKLAENISKYKKKGESIFIEGRLKLDQWETQDGTKRSKLRVVAEAVQFLNSGRREDSDGYGGEETEGRDARDRVASPPPRSPAPAPRPPTRQTAAEKVLNDPGYYPADESPPITIDDIPF